MTCLKNRSALIYEHPYLTGPFLPDPTRFPLYEHSLNQVFFQKELSFPFFSSLVT